MLPTGLRIKVWTHMSAVAIAGVAFATTHVESDPIIGTVIVVASICYLAFIRYRESESLREESGLRSSPLQRAGMLLDSVTIARVVIGLSDLACLISCYGYLRVADELFETCHEVPSSSRVGMVTGGIIGGFLAVCVASCLRRTVWVHNRPESWHTRRRLTFWWPVGLSMMIGGSVGCGSCVASLSVLYDDIGVPRRAGGKGRWFQEGRLTCLAQAVV